MKIKMQKYHALGNDYLVYDCNLNKKSLTENAVRLLCHRNFGAGSDGVLYGPVMEGGRIYFRIFNPDGGEAEKSGSGVRIFSKYLKDAGYMTENSFTLHTLGGPVEIEYLNERGSVIRAHMGKPTFQSAEIPVSGPAREVVNEEMRFGDETYKVTCVSVGNPHCVIPMDEISREKALALGPTVECFENFPNRINMQLLKVVDRKNIEIEIYERGAGYTLASGTSSCAAACAAKRLGLVDDAVSVKMPGGTLEIEMTERGVYMTGPVSYVGEFILSQEFADTL